MALAIPHRRKSQSTSTLMTWPSCGCGHPCHSGDRLVVRSLWRVSIVCEFVQTQVCLFIHSFIHFLRVCHSCSVALRFAGWSGCLKWLSDWFCQRVGLIFQDSHVAVHVDVMLTINCLSVVSRICNCSFIHSIKTVQFTVCFGYMAKILIFNLILLFI